MQPSLREPGYAPPEKLVDRLVRQLRNHALWDSLSVLLAPLLTSVYLLSYLYHAAWVNQSIFISLCVAAIVTGLVGAVLSYRPLAPSVRSAARLLDVKAEASDRFLTLATIEPTSCSEFLLARLRQETVRLMDRVELKRDFPYRIKRSCYGSLAGSIIAVILFHLLLPVAESAISLHLHDDRLHQLADRMAQRPGLSALARDVRALATKLQDQDIATPEKQKLIQELQKKVEEQHKTEEQRANQELLEQASGTLKGLEQETGNNQQKDQDKGGGGIQSDLPREGPGKGKLSQGSGAEGKDDLSAQQNKEMGQGKATPGDPKEQGKEKTQQGQADGKGNLPDPNKPDKEMGKSMTDRSPSGKEEKIGKSRSEDIPQGGPPVDRLAKLGAGGKDGIEGRGYVKVQLPEEIVADSKGGGGRGRESRERRARPTVPVSNVPLPVHVPDAPSEKQQTPLEYRGILR